MQTFRAIALRDPVILVWPLLTFAIAFLGGLVVRRMALGALNAWAAHKSRSAPILADALRSPTLIWALIAALHFSVQASALPARDMDWVSRALLVLVIVSFTLMGMRLAGNLVRFYGQQVPGAQPVTTLTETLAQLAVAILGFLLILSALHFEIAPILTALGVGGLAVALALQDTLSNLFSGFYVAVARQVRLGDYIKLNSGEEGYVSDIGWRSTTVRALANNLIVVPNAKLAQAIVVNYNLPEKRIAASVQVFVSYAADPDRVEAMLLDVVQRASGEVGGMLTEPPPGVAFDPGFGESGFGFTVNFHVSEFSAQFGARNEVRKRIWRRLREEGIEIPLPGRSVYLRGSDGPGAQAAHG